MKLKPVLTILAALCLIVLGALLPGLVARRQERQSAGQVLFSQVEDVKLEFAAESDITHSETLAILSRYKEAVEIPRELASLKWEKVETIAASSAERLRDTGLLLCDPEGDMLLSAQTVLYYGKDNQSNIYWLIQYGDRKGSHLFSMTVDDRTGTICTMEYMDHVSEYAAEQMETILRGFCQLYLTGQGAEFFDYSVDMLMEGAKQPQDRSYLATELSWEDPRYGNNRITFFVNRSGFYTYFA